MARYLLIEVDSNATADRLRAQIDSAGEAKGMKVVGMFTKATQLCECGEPARHPIHHTIIDVMGAKFKWRICPKCGKPRNGGHQTLWNILDPRRDTRMGYQVSHISVRWIMDKLGRVTTDMGENNG